MRRQLLVVECIFLYLAILHSGVVEAACQKIHNCDTCPGDNCTACIDRFYLYKDKGCYPCHSPCILCTSSGNSPCSLCSDGYYLDGTTCYKCYTGCKICIGRDYQQCTACSTGYYLTGETTCSQCRPACTACTDWNVCTSCESGYYHDTESSCNQCQSPCNACKSSTYCTSCTNGYYHEYESKGVCIPCQSNCKTCTDYECTSCADGYYRSGGSCNQCQSPCKACTSSTWCTTCTAGYYHSGGSCLQCQSPCKTCTAANSCTACDDGYYLGGAVCNKCATSCTKCSSVSQCTECVTGRYGRECTSACTKCKQDICDMNGVCTQGCIDGYYGDQCEHTCDESCLNQVCHRHNGTCIDVADMEPQNTGDASQTSSVVGPAVGAAVGAFVVVFVITAIVLYKRGYRFKLTRTPHAADDVAGNTRDDSTTAPYELPDTSRDDNISPYDELTIQHEYGVTSCRCDWRNGAYDICDKYIFRSHCARFAIPSMKRLISEMNHNQVGPDDLPSRHENLKMDGHGIMT